MLNIGRMGRGSARYYLDAVARAPADYYHGHGEAPGRWMGSGLGGLELELGLGGHPRGAGASARRWPSGVR